MRKFISGITALTLLFVNAFVPIESMASTVFFDEDFEQYQIGSEIEGFEAYSAAGTITADEISGNKVLYNSILNDGIYSTVSKKFAKAENFLNVFSLSFREKDSRSNGTAVAALYSEGTPVIKIVTAGNDIEYVTETDNVTIIEDYSPNVWYDIEIHVDTANKNVAIFADGELIAERLPYLNPVHFVDEFRSYGCCSPGYYLDNLKGYVHQDIYNNEIIGNTAPAIPSSGIAEYEYELVIIDAYGNNIAPGVVEYSLSPSLLQGVSLRTENNKAVLTIESTAIEQGITITATADSMAINVQKMLSIENAVPEKLEISGKNKIGGNGKYSYSAKLYNTSGTLSAGNILWSIENAPENVSIDSVTGTLSVKGELDDDGRFDIWAECSEAGLREKLTVTTVSSETYKRDNERFEAVKTALDNTLKYGTDPYRGTPLIADGLDAGSLTPALYRMNEDNELATSNLANQANLMMAFDAMTNLSGDTKYSERVREIYEYMWKHYTDQKSDVMYWGGHTTIDLRTGDPKGYSGNATPEMHEFKNHMPYLEPFFEIDSDRAAEMIKRIWALHIRDWKTLGFSRHGHYGEVINLDTTWNNTTAYDDSTIGQLLEKSGDMTFRNAANDLMYCAYTLFEQTGDETGLLWAGRMLERYNAVADPETKIGVYQYYEPLQRHDPWLEIEPIGMWNKVYPTPNEFTSSKYGDRAKNQFEQQFVEEGIITEDERWKIREAYMIGDGTIYKDGPLNDFKMAELFGTESREGKKIIKSAVEGMASFARLAYIPETNKFRYILSSGIDLTGYVNKTGGYYGDIGKVWTATTVSPGFIITFSKAYEMCGDTEEFADDKQEIWKVIRGLGQANNLGDLGETAPGDNADVNMLTPCADPYIIVGLINLYRSTGDPIYLQLARRIGDNIVAKNFNGRFFVASSSNKYIKFADSYAYILLMLEAETRNTPEAVTEFRLCEPYFHADILMDNGWQRSKQFDRSVYWTMTLPSVYVREIKTKSDYVELSPGETYELGVVVIPDDASSKTIDWSSSDEAVADTDGEKVYAYSEGVTVLRGISSDLQAKKQVTIRVKK